MAAPTVVGVGATAAGLGAVTPAFPGGYTAVADDVAVTFAETDTADTLTPPTNWAPITNANVSSGTTTRLWAIWRRLTASESAPQIADAGNHIVARMIVLRGCVTTGNPWDQAQPSTELVADTTVSITGVTTGVADCLVLAAFGTGQDIGSTAGATGWTNANLTGLTEQMDNWNTAGTGGGFAVASGVKATAGATGNTTATLSLTANFKAQLCIAFKPQISLVIADGTQAHSADNIALTQVHSLTVANTAQAHSADNTVLTQVHVLAAVDAAQAHNADNVTLVQVPTLIVANTDHAHSADNLVLEEHGAVNLDIAAADHSQSADSPALTQVHLLSADSGQHAQMADNLGLTQVHALSVAGADHTHSTDGLALTQAHTLAIQDASHAQTADQCQVNSAIDLTILGAAQAHNADDVMLTQAHQLLIGDAEHAHSADGLALTQTSELAIAAAVHAHAADNIALGSGNLFDLVIAPAQHQHAADTIKLTTHLIPAPKLSSRVDTTVHASTAAAVAVNVPSSRPTVTQRSGVA